MKDIIRTCTKCSLWKQRTLAIPGDGDSKIRVFFDKPNAEADRHGTHTVTQYYKEITKFMRKQRFPNVYVSSAVKCYGDTRLQNYKTCSQYLEKEFGKLNILLGNTVTRQALGADIKVSTHSYKIITKGPSHFIVAHHFTQLDYAQLEKILKEFLSRYSNQL